jgi:septal ring factor EnvC (AmiA/AmiB activator)
MARLLSIFKTIPPVLILVGSFICIAQSSLWADPTPVHLQDRIKNQEAKIKATKQRIVESEHAMTKLAEEEAPFIREIEGLNFQLNRLQRQARSLRFQITRLDREMAATREKSDRLALEIEALESYAEKRLVAFYKLSRLGIAPILISGASLFDTQQRMNALGRILDQDARTWETLHSKKEHLGGLIEKITAQRQEQDLLLARCDKETSDMTQKRAQRAVLLEKIQTEKALALAAVQSLKRSAKELDEAIRLLKQNDAPAKHTNSGGPFLAQKGALSMPAPGDLVAFFGPYQKEGPYNVKGFRNGVNIGTRPGAPVQAVWNGQVIYSDWFKGYGNIVIIDHGAQYYTLSAQLDQIMKKVGDQVLGGETVGTVGDTATYGGPGLYFEIRHQGTPLDPVPWFGN